MRRKARERNATRSCAERCLPLASLPSMKQHCPVSTSQFGLACGCPSTAGDYRPAECGDCDAFADKSVQRRPANLDQKVRLAISKLLRLLPPSRRPKSSKWQPIVNAM